MDVVVEGVELNEHVKGLLSHQLNKFKDFGELDKVFIWKIMQSRLFGIMDLDTHHKCFFAQYVPASLFYISF